MLKLSKQFSKWLIGKPSWIQDIAQFPCHDTHEHLETEESRLQCPINPSLIFSQYNPTDFAGAGLPKTIHSKFANAKQGDFQISPSQLKEIIKKYWSLTQTTGYGSVIKRFLDIYCEIDELTSDSVEKISKTMTEYVAKGMHNRMLTDTGIQTIQVCSFDMLENKRLPIRRAKEPSFVLLDFLVGGFFQPEIIELAQIEYDIKINDLDTWESALDAYFKDSADMCVAIKVALAYSRRLNFYETSREEIESLVKENNQMSQTITDEKFVNYGMNLILKKAGEHGIPVKFHTGHYAGAFSEPLERISMNLADIQPLIEKYSNTTFVLMHHAYPYGDAAATLAKSYPNCYIDQCWLWAMNPIAAVRYLKEFLGTAPSNKIFAFGGDYWHIEGIVGHMDLTRQGVCVALFEMVRDSWINSNEALEIGKNIFYRNQESVFSKIRKNGKILTNIT